MHRPYKIDSIGNKTCYNKNLLHKYNLCSWVIYKYDLTEGSTEHFMTLLPRGRRLGKKSKFQFFPKIKLFLKFESAPVFLIALEMSDKKKIGSQNFQILVFENYAWRSIFER